MRYFSDSEAKILNARVLRDDPSKIHAHVNVKKSEMKDAVRLLLSQNIWFSKRRAYILLVHQLAAGVACYYHHLRLLFDFPSQRLRSFNRCFVWL